MLELTKLSTPVGMITRIAWLCSQVRGWCVGIVPEIDLVVLVVGVCGWKLFRREKIAFFQLIIPVIEEFPNETTN